MLKSKKLNTYLLLKVAERNYVRNIIFRKEVVVKAEKYDIKENMATFKILLDTPKRLRYRRKKDCFYQTT